MLIKSNLPLLLILLLAIFLRFYHFDQRWVLNPDQAWAGVVGLEEIRHGTWPLIGFPSSAGPFNFGPYFFWLNGLFSTIFFFTPSAPWLGFALLSVVTVLLSFRIGQSVGDKNLGLVMALLFAISPPFVSESVNNMNTSLTLYTSTAALLCLALLIKKQKLVYAFLGGMFIGLSINNHFQSLGLLTLLPALLVIKTITLSRKLVILAVSGVGIAITFIPLLIFDFSHKFSWIQSVLNYYLHGQDKFYVPIRWLTEVRDFWPQLSGFIATGFSSTGLAIVLVIAGGFLLAIKKRVFPPFLIILLVSFLIQVLIIRYYKGPRSPEYFFFIQPYFLVFLSFSLYFLSKQNRLAGFLLLLTVTSTALFTDWKVVNSVGQAPKIYRLKDVIETKGMQKVDLYTIPPARNMITLPTFYLFHREGRISSSGYRIGLCEISTNIDQITGEVKDNCPEDYLIREQEGYRLYDLSRLDKEGAQKMGFEKLSSDTIYHWIYTNYGTR